MFNHKIKRYQKIKIKNLQVQLNKLEGERQALKIQLSNTQKEYQLKQKTIKSIQNKIVKYNSKDNIEVSEHAIIRYFERVLGYDIEQIKSKILTNEIISLTQTLGGNGSYPNDGFKIILKNFTVVTLLKE